MARYRSPDLAELTRQLCYAPPERRREQIERAEQLYWQIDKAVSYPLEFIAYRITRFRLETTEDVLLTGDAVRHDLPLVVEQLSRSLGDPAESLEAAPVAQAELCRRWRVTSQTLSRYRRDGLFCRYVTVSGRLRVVYLPASIERYAQAHPGASGKVVGFTRLDKETRRAVIRRARRLKRRVASLSPFQVARHLGRKYKRPAETIRQLLLRHDRRRPEKAIFTDYTPPLGEKQQRAIYRAYVRGESVAEVSRRFGRGRNAVYRAINIRRALAVRSVVLRYIVTPTFELPEAEEVILRSPLPPLPRLDAASPLARAAGLSAKAEAALFVRYNYLKYRADTLRKALGKYQPSSRQLDGIETYLRRAVVIKRMLVAANLGAVIAVSRRHLSASGISDDAALEHLIAQGNAVLLEAVESYDTAKHSRFGTYLNWALMRRFAQQEAAAAHRPAVDVPRSLDVSRAGLKESAASAAALKTLLEHLDERERFVITRYFGVSGEEAGGEPQSLADVAAELKVTLEVARQIERRAAVKLREAAARLGVELGELDALGAA